jgi:O-antigen ligase
MVKHKKTIDFSLKIVAYLFGMFVLFPNKVKPYLILLLFLVTCFLYKKSNLKLLLNKGLPLFFLFLMYFISLFYSCQIDTGINLILRMTPLFILPYSFCVIGLANNKLFFSNFKKTFIISLVIYTILIFIYLYKLNCLFGNNSLGLGYSYITNEFYGINDHPIYISSYFCIGLLTIIYDKNTNKYFSFFAFFTILSGLIILSRKGSIIAFLISITYYLFFNKNQLFKALLIFSSILLLIFSIPEINNRFFELANTEKTLNTSTGIRQIIWKNALELTSKSNFFGFGIGDVQNELDKKYSEQHLYLLAKDKYNAHNQYIQIMLTIGYVGLFLFIITLIYFIFILHLEKNYFGVSVLIFFYILFNTESYLERQNGIIFFSLMFCLLNYSEQKKENRFNFPLVNRVIKFLLP